KGAGAEEGRRRVSLLKACQNALPRRCRKGRILRRPTDGAQFGVTHTLVAITALALPFPLFNRRERTIQLLGQPTVTFALQNRLIVNHIIALPRRRWVIQKKKKCRRNVVPVDLVNKSIVPRINARFAGQKFAQQRGASWSINAGKPRDDATVAEHEFFCLKQYSTRLARRFGLAFFGDPRTIALRINARAAREQHPRSTKPIEKMTCPVQVDLPVSIGGTAVGAGAVDYRVKHSRVRRDLSLVCDIDPVNGIRFSGNLPTRFAVLRPAFY